MSFATLDRLMDQLPNGGAVLFVAVALDPSGEVRTAEAQVYLKGKFRNNYIQVNGDDFQLVSATADFHGRRAVTLDASWPTDIQSTVAAASRLTVQE